jgi:hypothetical protein
MEAFDWTSSIGLWGMTERGAVEPAAVAPAMMPVVALRVPGGPPVALLQCSVVDAKLSFGSRGGGRRVWFDVGLGGEGEALAYASARMSPVAPTHAHLEVRGCRSFVRGTVMRVSAVAEGVWGLGSPEGPGLHG